MSDTRTVSAAEAVAIALEHHRAGRNAEAEHVYRRILESNPQHADALHLLGVALHQRGEHRQAAEMIGQANRLLPGRPEMILNLGAAYAALGRVAEAESQYRAALEVAPEFFQAASNLGLLLHKHAHYAEAVRWLGRAVELAPENPDAHNNLALTLQAAGRKEEAEHHLRTAIELSPGLWAAHYNLGNLLQESGRMEEAVPAYRHALSLNPSYAPLHGNLGAALHKLRRHEEAENSYRAALALDPAYAEAMSNLGNLLQHLRRFDEALHLLRAAIAAAPGAPEAYINLGAALKTMGLPAEAGAVLRDALRLQPANPAAHCTYGAVLDEMGEFQQAESHLRKAIELKPDLAEAHNNLGCSLMARGKLGEAEACFRTAVSYADTNVDAWNNLAETLKNSGRVNEAEEYYQKTLALEPNNAVVHSNLLSTMNYRDGITLAELAEAHAEFARRHEEPLRSSWKPHDNDRDPDRPLRLGFVSGDFGLHPIGYLMTDVLDHLDRAQFKTVVYSHRHKRDSMTQQLAGKVDEWHEVAHISDEALAKKIRADRIDVLFDLSGHTGYNRLPAFAHKPAPVQVTWMGYAGSTGLKSMDYLLSDKYLVSEEGERFYSEKIVRMPGAVACYRVPDGLIQVGPQPAAHNGFVTFCSFNNPSKVTPGTIALWSSVLKQVPTARMVLKYLGFDDVACQERYADQFSREGVDPRRLTFLGRTSLADMFACYNQVDISLDPFPYTGGTTTLLSLAMGVPVITIFGETMSMRQSFGNLTTLGLEELTTTKAEDFVQRARALATDLSRLSALRASLRGRLLQAPFMNAIGFTRELEATVRRLWRRWSDSSMNARA